VAQQQASLTLSVALDEIEGRLRDVTGWDRFLIGVDSVTQTAHERYRFRLAEGREVPVAVRFRSGGHRFSWCALSGPPFDGDLRLARVDATQTRITLRLTTRPAGTMANLLDMITTSTSRAVVDLQRLESYLRRAGGHEA
jgi:hypothetical protein